MITNKDANMRAMFKINQYYEKYLCICMQLLLLLWAIIVFFFSFFILIHQNSGQR